MAMLNNQRVINEFDTGWWFQTFFFPFHIWDSPSHWLKFFRGVETTNQDIISCLGLVRVGGWEDRGQRNTDRDIIYHYHCIPQNMPIKNGQSEITEEESTRSIH